MEDRTHLHERARPVCRIHSQHCPVRKGHIVHLHCAEQRAWGFFLSATLMLATLREAESKRE
eukprot:1157601-Pelagomonas_calceolata.AAC.2